MMPLCLTNLSNLYESVKRRIKKIAKKPAKSQSPPKRQIEKKSASIAVPIINDKNLCLGIGL